MYSTLKRVIHVFQDKIQNEKANKEVKLDILSKFLRFVLCRINLNLESL